MHLKCFREFKRKSKWRGVNPNSAILMIDEMRKRKRIRKMMLWGMAALIILTYGSVWLARQSIPLLRQIAVHEARNATSAIFIEAVREQPFSLRRTSESYMTVQINEAITGILTRAYNKFVASDIVVLDHSSTVRKVPAGVIYKVPLGYLMHVPFLVNRGPMIPIRMRLLGDVMGTMKSKVTPYGINNALLEVSIELKVRVQVMSFLDQQEIEVLQEIPLALEVFEGEVPHYFPWSQAQTSSDAKVVFTSDEKP